MRSIFLWWWVSHGLCINNWRRWLLYPQVLLQLLLHKKEQPHHHWPAHLLPQKAQVGYQLAQQKVAWITMAFFMLQSVLTTMTRELKPYGAHGVERTASSIQVNELGIIAVPVTNHTAVIQNLTLAEITSKHTWKRLGAPAQGARITRVFAGNSTDYPFSILRCW